jgi:tetraacyldisaccharide 4'-kinase
MRAPNFWQKRGLLSACLLPASWPLRVGAKLRRMTVRPQILPVPVFCIGNVTVGGSGKTPLSLGIQKRLLAHGVHGHFLTRGYGGSLKGPVKVDIEMHSALEVGDEALLLARQAPCWVSANRSAGALAAVESGAGAIIMDDGFQNPSLQKTLSLIAVDSTYGFGNGRVMPAGPLREPLGEGLARADGVIIVGPRLKNPAMSEIYRIGKPVVGARLVASDVSKIAGRPVIAFAGIGRPGKFFETLREIDCEIIAKHEFADHQPYDMQDIGPIIKQASEAGLSVVTTEKDLVRVPESLRAQVLPLRVEIEWDDAGQIDALLKKAI